MHLFAFSHDLSVPSLENWKVTNRPLQLQMWNGAKAGPVTMKNDCSIETWVTLESVKPHTQQRLCLNFGIPKSKHKRITSNTGCRSTCIPKFWSSSIRFSNQSGTSKDQTIQSQTLSGGTFRVFREKPRGIFARLWNLLFQSGENSREIPTAKPRDTFHLSSASLRPDFCDYSTFASPLSRQNLLKVSSISESILFYNSSTNSPIMDWVT